MDPIATFKENQREGWSTFTPLESITGTVAPRLVRFARITGGQRVLDAACGTGVVALTAARKGAHVTGLDLTPALLQRARENATMVGVSIDFHEGDVEALPFADSTFDVVVSQFGHMFAPRPDHATRELLRVLKPGGTLAFATWPPELIVGRVFSLAGRYAPPPPPGVSPPPQWGDPTIVRERLGDRVRDLTFDRERMFFPTLSPRHYRTTFEGIGPVTKLVHLLSSEPERLAAFRKDLEDAVSLYFRNNTVRQDYLLTRAIKA